MGACLGSFANVIIFRLPRGESIVVPRSRCPHCATPIKWYDNVPIFSWFILRGKCRACPAKISIRYPLVELLMAVLFVAVFYKFQWTWFTAEVLLFTFGLVTVSFIDLDHMILPDKLTLPGIAIGLIGALINPERVFLDAIIGVLIGGGFLYAVAYLYFVVTRRDGMGGGDIKLLAWVGAVLGWQAIPLVVLVSCVVGSVIGLGIAASTKGGLRMAIPFGPYIVIAAFVYIFTGNKLIDWYLQGFVF